MDEEPAGAVAKSKKTKKKLLNVDALTDKVLHQLFVQFVSEQQPEDKEADVGDLGGGAAADGAGAKKAVHKRKRGRKQGSTRAVAAEDAAQVAGAKARKVAKEEKKLAAAAGEKRLAERALALISAAKVPVRHFLAPGVPMPRNASGVAGLSNLFKVSAEQCRIAAERVNADKERSGAAFGEVVRRAESEMSAAAARVPLEDWAETWNGGLRVRSKAASADASASSHPPHPTFSAMGKTARAARGARPKVGRYRLTPVLSLVEP